MRWCYSCMHEIEADGLNCPICGKKLDRNYSDEHLAPGTVLDGKFIVGYALGQGGFGITYIGYDTSLDMRVAIKEFFPTGYASRTNVATHEVSCGTEGGERRDIFETGKDRFMKEAKILAKFSGQPGIVDVRAFFEENNTAYIVMEYLEGETLKAYLARKGTISMEETLSLLKPVMTSLRKVHTQGLIHRDISPDNIMLVDDKIKLLDFGAARDVSPNGNKSLSVMLKPGFAPEEQYRTRGQQGPWTDVYALSATIYKCITGVTPDESPQRTFKDELKKPSELGVKIDEKYERALMKGLALYQTERYQNIDELLAGFEGIEIPDTEKTVLLMRNGGAGEETKLLTKKPAGNDNGRKKKIVLYTVIALLLIAVAILLGVVIEGKQKENATGEKSGQVAETQGITETVNSSGEALQQNSETESKNPANEGAEDEPVHPAGEGSESSSSDDAEDNLNADAEYVPISTVGIGTIVRFGSYEQDNDTSNGKEPIEWEVIDTAEGCALLVSRYALDCKQYHNSNLGVTWENCSLRSWLNEEFLNMAFSAKEQEDIILTTVETLPNPQNGVDGGNATEDRVFILSLDEVEKYWPGLTLDTYNTDRMVQATQYAVAQNAYVLTTNDYNSYFGLVPKDMIGASCWWLRTPGQGKSYATHVFGIGSINYMGVNVNEKDGAVRPAIWVKVEHVIGQTSSVGSQVDITPTAAPTLSPTPTEAPIQAPTEAPTAAGVTPTATPTTGVTPTATPTTGVTPTATPTTGVTPTATPTQEPTQDIGSTPDIIAINKTNFPDDTFRDYVSHRFDFESDGYLDKSEMEAVGIIDVQNYGIKSLEGIQYFPELFQLWCQNNQLIELDLSKNTALRDLYCYENKLAKLEISGCSKLEGIICHSNELTKLDVSKNTALTNLDCEHNRLTKLNLSKNAALIELFCGYNELQELDISKNTKLNIVQCVQNQLSELDLSMNTSLTQLYCSGNQIDKLDARNCPEDFYTSADYWVVVRRK